MSIKDVKMSFMDFYEDFMDMEKYAFWNNKGGTGKTSLAFQAICDYAHQNSDKKILAIDVCPQANLSELFLGGLDGNGSSNLLKRQGEIMRATIGGYFQIRLPSPYTIPSFEPNDFITTPNEYNKNIPENIDLVCGDPLLELQSNAVSTLANTQIPGTDTWVSYHLISLFRSKSELSVVSITISVTAMKKS